MCVLVIDMSADGPTVVGSPLELFVGSGSEAGEETSAVFVTEGAAAAPTSTTTVTVLVAPDGSGPVLVQLTSCPAAEQVHPFPLPDTKDKPAGSVSAMTMGPAASAGPAFETRSVYVPWPPAMKFPACDFVRERSAEPLEGVVAESVLLEASGSATSELACAVLMT